MEVTVDLPNFQAPTVFLLLYDDLLRWTLLVLHLIHSMISASHSYPNMCIEICSLCDNMSKKDGSDMLGAKALGGCGEIKE